jgi:hypothetical protein
MASFACLPATDSSVWHYYFFLGSHFLPRISSSHHTSSVPARERGACRPSRRSGRPIIPTPCSRPVTQQASSNRCRLPLPPRPCHPLFGVSPLKSEPSQRSLFPIDQPHFLKPPPPVPRRRDRNAKRSPDKPLRSTPPARIAHQSAPTTPSPRRTRRARGAGRGTEQRRHFTASSTVHDDATGARARTGTCWGLLRDNPELDRGRAGASGLWGDGERGGGGGEGGPERGGVHGLRRREQLQLRRRLHRRVAAGAGEEAGVLRLRLRGGQAAAQAQAQSAVR